MAREKKKDKSFTKKNNISGIEKNDVNGAIGEFGFNFFIQTILADTLKSIQIKKT